MKLYEIGTGYTAIPAKISAATEIVTESLAKALHRLGYDISIVDIQTEDRPDIGIPICEVPVPKVFSGTDIHLGLLHKCKRVVYSLSLARVLKDILRRSEKSVVFHFHNQYNLFFFLHLTPARLRKRCVIAYTNHSGIWRLEWESIAKAVRIQYFQEAFCMKHADLVFVLNDETKENIITHLGVPEKRIFLVPNGVDTERYHPLPEKEIQTAKEAFGLTEPHILLQVGSVCENKGQLRAIQELLPLLQPRKDIVYAYAGGIIEETYQQQIQQFVKEHDIAKQVRYLGMIEPGEELNRLYNTATMTILPSRYEAFSLVVVESLAVGIPVLGNLNMPLGFRDGYIGYPSGSLAETVRSVLTNSNAELGTVIRNNTLQHYSWEAVAKQYADRMVNHG